MKAVPSHRLRLAPELAGVACRRPAIEREIVVRVHDGAYVVVAGVDAFRQKKASGDAIISVREATARDDVASLYSREEIEALVRAAPVAVMPEEIERWIAAVCASLASFDSAWIVGSRINGCERERSDWDIIVRTDRPETVSSAVLPHPRVDLLLWDARSNAICSPWNNKALSLDDLAWHEFPRERYAEYTGTRARLEEFNTNVLRCKARRIR